MPTGRTTDRASGRETRGVVVPAPRTAADPQIDPLPPAPVGAVGPVHWTEVLAELHAWAGVAMGLGRDAGEEPVPVFGSPQWCALAEDDPRRAAAIARAAMAWWTDQQTRADQQATDHTEASHAIATGTDWTRVARDRRQHR